MKKQVTKLLLIIMLAVLFVPLFSNSSYAMEYSLSDMQSYYNNYIKTNFDLYLEENIIESGYLDLINNSASIYEFGLTMQSGKKSYNLIGFEQQTTVSNLEIYNNTVIADLSISDQTTTKINGSTISYITMVGGKWHIGESTSSNLDTKVQSIDYIKEFTGKNEPDFNKGFDDDGYGIRFLLPRNGFKDNSYLFVYYIEYRFPPFLRNLSIRVEGDYIEGTGKQENLISELEPDNSVNGTIKFTVGHEIGVNTIRAYAKYPDGTEFGYEAFRQIERLGGFIDEDGDGKDDRTGREDNNEEKPWYHDDYNPDGNRPNREEYGEDIIGTVSYYFDTLLYWLLSPFRLISEGLQSTLAIVTETFGWAGNFANMIGGLFSFLPSEITGMITLAFTSLIVFTIIKAVRK